MKSSLRSPADTPAHAGLRLDEQCEDDGTQAKLPAPPRRAKSWTLPDRIVVCLLLTISVATVLGDFAIIYIYLTSTNKLPGLIDNPEYAFLWAAILVAIACALAMLPYFSPRHKRIRWRFFCGTLAVFLFIVVWVPTFVVLFSSGISDTKEVLEQLWRGVPKTGGPYEDLLKWAFMGGQIICFVLVSSSCWLSVLIMVEDRRVERLIKNPVYEELTARRNALKFDLALANHKLGNHKGIFQLIKLKSKEHGESAVGFLRAARGGR